MDSFTHFIVYLAKKKKKLRSTGIVPAWFDVCIMSKPNNKGYTLKWSLQMIIKLTPDRFFRNWCSFPGVVWQSSFHYRHASVLIGLQLYLGFSDNHLSSFSQQHEHGQNLCHWFSTKSSSFAWVSSYSLILWQAIVSQPSSPTGTFTEYTSENSNAQRQNSLWSKANINK